VVAESLKKKGFRQLLLRCVEKVRAELAMICNAHNRKKLVILAKTASFGWIGKTGRSLRDRTVARMATPPAFEGRVRKSIEYHLRALQLQHPERRRIIIHSHSAS